MSDRERSRSPRREKEEPRPKKTTTTGFKWKEKKSSTLEDSTNQEPADRLERGYRNRSPRRDTHRDRDDKPKDEPPRKDSSKPSATKADSSAAEPKKSLSKDEQWAAARSTSTTSSAKSTKPKAPVSSEPMIVVNINDRLGTKAAIPCMASDSIKMFKAVVAAHIGRQPHEIMLKRQGERPFKDMLTLEDYGVSNGVQLDLEIDTGD